MIRVLCAMIFLAGQPDNRPSPLTIGPIDHFKANQGAIKASLDFEYTTGFAGEDFLDRKRAWDRSQRSFAVTADQTIQGRWEFDGTAVHVIRQTPPEIWQARIRPNRADQFQGYTFPMECLYGQGISAHHDFAYFPGHNASQGINVFAAEVPPNILPGDGPFCWTGLFPLDQVIEQKFARTSTRREETGTIGKFSVVHEFYEMNNSEGWVILQISYDPSIGYLPRYARTTSLFKGKASIRETFVLEVSRSDSGGFVPMEWYQAFYQVGNFEAKYPRFRDEPGVPIAGTTGKISVSRFLGSNFESRKDPVSLDQIQDMKAIVGVGATVPLMPHVTSLTLTDLRNARVTESPTATQSLSLPPPIHIDQDELLKYPTKPEDSPTPSITIIGLSLFGVFLVSFFARKHIKTYKSMLMLLLIAWATGCSPQPNLSVYVVPNARSLVSITESQKSAYKMSFDVVNRGNVPVTIQNLDAGCSCRSLDKSRLPLRLAAGDTATLQADFQNQTEYGKQSFNLKVITDRGDFTGPLVFFSYPDQLVSPSSPSNFDLLEGSKWEFRLSHRRTFIGVDGESERRPSIQLPKEFEVTAQTSISGTISDERNIRYTDTTYTIALKDESLGFKKASIGFEGDSSSDRLEIVVSWKRLAYLATVPDRVILRDRPLRVFLRCPDDSVELLKVTSAPKGIRVVITSTREMLVSLDDLDPSLPIDGTIEVETSARTNQSLKIPVAHLPVLPIREDELSQDHAITSFNQKL